MPSLHAGVYLRTASTSAVVEDGRMPAQFTKTMPAGAVAATHAACALYLKQPRRFAGMVI